jgi:Mg-chelatase subunit ChlD
MAATLRATALSRAMSRSSHAPVFPIDRDDLRIKVRTRARRPLIVLVVDCSESMESRARMTAAKETVMRLLSRAHLTRDRIAVVAFGEDRAWTVVPPTSSISLARDRMRSLKASGATPLAAGLEHAWKMILSERVRDPGTQACLVVISDGEANVPLRPGPFLDAELQQLATRLRTDGVTSLVVDTNPRAARSALMRRLATWLGASAPGVGTRSKAPTDRC